MNIPFLHQAMIFMMVWFILVGIFHFILTLFNVVNNLGTRGFIDALIICFVGTLPGTIFILAGTKGLWILLS